MTKTMRDFYVGRLKYIGEWIKDNAEQIVADDEYDERLELEVRIYPHGKLSISTNRDMFVPYIPKDYKVKEYEIWCEGYLCTGASGKHRYIGKSKGRTFEDACYRYFKKHPDESYNRRSNTIWGCKLYRSERESASTFG